MSLQIGGNVRAIFGKDNTRTIFLVLAVLVMLVWFAYEKWPNKMQKAVAVAGTAAILS
jgi:hypothetical protein